MKQSDKLHVSAVCCAWSGPISAVGLLNMGKMTVGGKEIESPGLPCCPHCKSVLMQYDEAEWWQGAERHEKAGATNYVEFLKWKEAQNKCFQTVELAADAFRAETGKPLKLVP